MSASCNNKGFSCKLHELRQETSLVPRGCAPPPVSYGTQTRRHNHLFTTAGLWRSLAWAVLDSVPRSGNAWQPRQPKQPPDLLMRHPLKGQGCSPAHPTLRPSDQRGQGLPRLHQRHLLHGRWLCMRLRQTMRLGFRRLSHRWLSFHLFHLAATMLYFAIDTCRLVAHLHGFCAHPLGCTVPYAAMGRQPA